METILLSYLATQHRTYYLCAGMYMCFQLRPWNMHMLNYTSINLLIQRLLKLLLFWSPIIVDVFFFNSLMVILYLRYQKYTCKIYQLSQKYIVCAAHLVQGTTLHLQLWQHIHKCHHNISFNLNKLVK